jgi:hypothetical protein
LERKTKVEIAKVCTGSQECESSLKHKTELISKLEAKTFAMTDTLQIMDDKYVLCHEYSIRIVFVYFVLNWLGATFSGVFGKV